MVGISDGLRHLGDYPHQFSGGMRQRVMIAMSLACNPSLLIADEPTTALDVTIQAQIVELVTKIRQQVGMAVIWITHDLGVVAGIADRVIVMYAGFIVEEAGVDDLYEDPAPSLYERFVGSIAACRSAARPAAEIDSWCATQSVGGAAAAVLLSGVANMPSNAARPKTHPLLLVGPDPYHCLLGGYPHGSCPMNAIQPLVIVENLTKHFPVMRGIIIQHKVGAVRAVDGISFTIDRGETLGLVGESGCGKTTAGRTLLGLYPATGGTVTIDGHNVQHAHGSELLAIRRKAQMIFQDPYASLNPSLDGQFHCQRTDAGTSPADNGGRTH